jgi:hypothetical protein
LKPSPSLLQALFRAWLGLGLNGLGSAGSGLEVQHSTSLHFTWEVTAVILKQGFNIVLIFRHVLFGNIGEFCGGFLGQLIPEIGVRRFEIVQCLPHLETS